MSNPARAAFLANLDAALAAAENLRMAVDKAFPGADVPELSLEGLTVDERIALGNRACEQLHDLAMKIAPEATLDHMDEQLPIHTESLAESQALLARLGAGR